MTLDELLKLKAEIAKMDDTSVTVAVLQAIRRRDQSSAELLLDLVHWLLHPRDALLYPDPDDPTPLEEPDRFFALLKVALDFHTRGPGFWFRAIVEDWDALRINRELY